jgi:hypothetical protein
MEFD